MNGDNDKGKFGNKSYIPQNADHNKIGKAMSVSKSLVEKSMRVDLSIKAELFKLVRKEDAVLYERIKPSHYPELIRQTWYGVFDPSRSEEEKLEHHKAIRNVLEIYSRNDTGSCNEICWSSAFRWMRRRDVFQNPKRETVHCHYNVRGHHQPELLHMVI